MRKLIAYMITWTTYGSWLQGDNKGYVKKGKILKPNPKLQKSNQVSLRQPIVKLTNMQKSVVQNAILQEAKRINHKIHAITVCSNHVHIVAENNGSPIHHTIARYKNVSTSALKRTGYNRKTWTKGYDKRFCFTKEQLKQRIEYVIKHNPSAGRGAKWVK